MRVVCEPKGALESRAGGRGEPDVGGARVDKGKDARRERSDGANDGVGGGDGLDPNEKGARVVGPEREVRVVGSEARGVVAAEGEAAKDGFEAVFCACGVAKGETRDKILVGEGAQVAFGGVFQVAGEILPVWVPAQTRPGRIRLSQFRQRLGVGVPAMMTR